MRLGGAPAAFGGLLFNSCQQASRQASVDYCFRVTGTLHPDPSFRLLLSMHLGRARTARATVALALAFAQASGASERCSTAPIRPTQQRAGDATGTQGLLL